MQLPQILVQYKGTFADLGMVPRSIVEHKLGVPSGTKLTFYKKRVFAKARQEFIRKEVQKSLAVGVVKLIDFPEYLSN